MSHVTDIILFTESIDEDCINTFNRQLADALGVTPTSKTWMLLQPLDTDVLCGPKVFTSRVYACTWNNCHHQIPILVDLVKKFPWSLPESVVLLVNDESDETILVVKAGGTR